MTGPGRLRLDFGGVGGCENNGGSEGGQDDKRLDVMSEVEFRTRGISRAILFAFVFLLLTWSNIIIFVCTDASKYYLLLRRVDLRPPARVDELSQKAVMKEPYLVNTK